jgi:hypothetical protein
MPPPPPSPGIPPPKLGSFGLALGFMVLEVGLDLAAALRFGGAFFFGGIIFLSCETHLWVS